MAQNFAITGVGGYIAPRHLKAIYDTGNRVVCALDRHESVGLLDRFSPDIDFFTEFERFDRHVEKIRRRPELGRKVDYVSICSPNYLHDAHIRFALRTDADAICEKPLVLNPWNIDALQELEAESGRRVYCILQLRNHPAIRRLKSMHQAQPHRKAEISLDYVTSRGKWYQSTWKSQVDKSGGLTTNIGIHFFDMLLWIFGRAVDSRVHIRSDRKAAGFLELERARVHWFLSIDREDILRADSEQSQITHRSIKIDGQELEFSGGFADLHTEVYRDILAGRGYGMEAARPSIELAYDIRHSEPVGWDEEAHPMVRKVVDAHDRRVLRARNGRRGSQLPDRKRDPSLAL